MLKKAPVGKAVIIDLLSDVSVNDDMRSDDYLMEAMLSFILKDLPSVVNAKPMPDIQTKPDIPSKLAKISEELREFGGKSLVTKDIDEILANSFKRIKLFANYRLNMKFRTNRTHIREEIYGNEWKTGLLLNHFKK